MAPITDCTQQPRPMASAKVGIIDCSLLDGSKADVEKLAETWSESMRTVGCVYLVKHGLTSAYHAVSSQWQSFCDMPLAKKEQFATLEYGGSGYNRAGREAVANSDGNNGEKSEQKTDVQGDLPLSGDPVESLECGYDSSFPAPFPCAANGYEAGDSLKDNCQKLYWTVEELLKKLLKLSSIALDLPDEKYFEEKWFEKGPGANTLRMAHYLPDMSTSIVPVDDSKIVCDYGEHTDYDGFTFLWRNRTNGLQVKKFSETENSPEWEDVPVLESDPDALVLNAGDLMQRWTNDYWVSPPHRVKKDVARYGPSKDKISIVYFVGPHGDTRLTPLPFGKRMLSTLSDDEQGYLKKPRYDVVTAEEHVQGKIQASQMN